MSPEPNGHSAEFPAGTDGPDEASLQLDLLRADLYRLLDELARAPSEDREALLDEFQRVWERFKDATAPDR